MNNKRRNSNRPSLGQILNDAVRAGFHATPKETPSIPTAEESDDSKAPKITPKPEPITVP